MVTPADVARVRAATASRKAPWTLKELEPTLPRRLEAQPAWKLTASHASETAADRADDAARGTSGAPQAPGMWFQIELPQPVMVTEVEFDSPGAPAGRGGGGRARRRRLAAAPAPPGAAVSRAAIASRSRLDGTKWGKAGRRGQGRGAHTTITFAPVRAKFVRITQTDTVENAPNWAMANLRLYEAGPGK